MTGPVDEQTELPMDQAVCLEEYQGRIDRAWAEIHRHNHHFGKLFPGPLAKIARRYGLSSVIVLDLHRKLQDALVEGLINDHFQYSIGNRLAPGMEVPLMLRDRVRSGVTAMGEGKNAGAY